MMHRCFGMVFREGGLNHLVSVVVRGGQGLDSLGVGAQARGHMVGLVKVFGFTRRIVVGRWEPDHPGS